VFNGFGVTTASGNFPTPLFYFDEDVFRLFQIQHFTQVEGSAVHQEAVEIYACGDGVAIVVVSCPIRLVPSDGLIAEIDGADLPTIGVENSDLYRCGMGYRKRNHG
jgi:hypothetical protein